MHKIEDGVGIIESFQKVTKNKRILSDFSASVYDSDNTLRYVIWVIDYNEKYNQIRVTDTFDMSNEAQLVEKK